MQISSLNDIIQGEFLNSPAITSVYNIKSRAKKVTEGDLFFALCPEDIPTALKNGAFAIVVENDHEVLDNEVAWIKVDDLNKAIVRYIRYVLSQFELQAYYCNHITYEMLKLFKTSHHNHIKFISNNVSHNIKLLNTLENQDTIFCMDQTLLDAIYPKNENFNDTNFVINNLIEHSLFETSFSYLNDFFSKLRISSLYLNEFLKVYYFFNKSVDLNRLKRFELFKPIFIDKYFNMTEYGRSDKFILVQEDESQLYKEMYYIKEKYKYAKTILISKEKIAIDGITNFVVQELEEIYKTLQYNSFNAVYIVGFNKKHVELLFSNNNSTQPLL